MKLLIKTTDYNECIKVAKELKGTFNESVNFHCFWFGQLSEKHLYSIKSCYYFNVFNNKHKIILWIQNNIPNKFNIEISKYAEIRNFNLGEEQKGTFLENYQTKFPRVDFYADYVRSVLLYKYGGCWFDLDCFFLRCFDPLFCSFKDEVCLYQWENQNYPNNAIYISLRPRSEKMRTVIEFFIKRDRGWGFQQAMVTYDIPLDITVLPCIWFDPDWVINPYNFGVNFISGSDGRLVTFENFHQGTFCYHWHNKWNMPITPNSYIKQLINIIEQRM